MAICWSAIIPSTSGRHPSSGDDVRGVAPSLALHAPAVVMLRPAAGEPRGHAAGQGQSGFAVGLSGTALTANGGAAVGGRRRRRRAGEDRGLHDREESLVRRDAHARTHPASSSGLLRCLLRSRRRHVNVGQMHLGLAYTRTC